MSEADVRGTAGRHKQYVSVVARMGTDGDCTPLFVEWDDGTRYVVSEVLDVRSAASRTVEGSGVRYTVRIGHTETYLFRDGDRWFVEAKEATLA